MSWNFETVVGPLGTLTEGPAWDGSGILFTHIRKNRILRYNPQTRETTLFKENTNEANGLMFDDQGHLYACEGVGRRIVRYETNGSVTALADRFHEKRLNSPNDLAIDKSGRIWFTDPRYGNRSNMELAHDSVFRLDPEPDGSNSIKRVTYDTTRPNGILLSPNQNTLYVAETNIDAEHNRELRSYSINDDASIGEYVVLHDFAPHRSIDGMCLDTEGNIVATAGSLESGPGPMIYVFSPTGEVIERHPLPADKPTNCTFGDIDLRTLYVTTTSGHLLRARTERQGHLLYPNFELRAAS